MKQKQMFEQFEKMVKDNTISHAYLFEIDNYESVEILFGNLVKKILVKNSKNKQLEEKLIEENNHPDLKIISNAMELVKKNDLKKLMEEFGKTPVLSDKRIYILEGIENYNISSINSILKFLEEPEPNIIAFLLTNNRYKVVDTIVSRCQIYDISNKENSIDIKNEEKIKNLYNIFIGKNTLFLEYNFLNTSYFADKASIITNLENLSLFIINKIERNEISNSDIKLLQTIKKNTKYLEFNVNIKVFLDGLYADIEEVLNA